MKQGRLFSGYVFKLNEHWYSTVLVASQQGLGSFIQWCSEDSEAEIGTQSHPSRGIKLPERDVSRWPTPCPTTKPESPSFISHFQRTHHPEQRSAPLGPSFFIFHRRPHLAPEVCLIPDWSEWQMSRTFQKTPFRGFSMRLLGARQDPSLSIIRPSFLSQILVRRRQSRRGPHFRGNRHRMPCNGTL